MRKFVLLFCPQPVWLVAAGTPAAQLNISPH